VEVSFDASRGPQFLLPSRAASSKETEWLLLVNDGLSRLQQPRCAAHRAAGVAEVHAKQQLRIRTPKSLRTCAAREAIGIYLDGWREKDNRPALLFGRCFEQALAAFFVERTAVRCCSMNGANTRTLSLNIPRGDSWERMFRQGIQLPERLAQDS